MGRLPHKEQLVLSLVGCVPKRSVPCDSPLDLTFLLIKKKAPVSFNEYLKQYTSFIFSSRVKLPTTQQGHSFRNLIIKIAGCFFIPAPCCDCDASPRVCFGRILVWKATRSMTSYTKTPPSSTWWTQYHTSCCSAWLERCNVLRRSVHFVPPLRNTCRVSTEIQLQIGILQNKAFL